ncbi:flagellar biosynthesis anti-sigma factor FlgM [Ferrimonas senticii]|uniref:flagellar biosynthesis anti-sigma factor FlgM n=1 Tax=Ferrimonas senticii TaxID=394566 RepID=UPI00040AC362|nr:flagellar biosynthesis anti-sigma factor FlgM [Ferrimonas senticii]
MDPLKSLTGNARPLSQLASAGNNQTAQAAGAEATVAKQDAVSLTPQAQQLQRAEAALDSADGIDMDKVAAVRAAIVEGRYQIDAERLADNLMRFEQELNG